MVPHHLITVSPKSGHTDRGIVDLWTAIKPLTTIATSDPGEAEFRGIFLTAPYGKGTYTYSSLIWFREIPNLVPGAIRMFINMISVKR